jgi:hypothetical protein
MKKVEKISNNILIKNFDCKMPNELHLLKRCGVFIATIQQLIPFTNNINN